MQSLLREHFSLFNRHFTLARGLTPAGEALPSAEHDATCDDSGIQIASRWEGHSDDSTAGR